MTNKPNNQSAQEVDVEKLALEKYPIQYDEDNDSSPYLREAFIDGYNQALQSKAGRYSEEQLKMNCLLAYQEGFRDSEAKSIMFKTMKPSEWFKRFIQSLTSTPIQTKGSELKDRLFNLANDFAVAKQGDIAVQLHSIHNKLD